MASLHQISTSSDGSSFINMGPLIVVSQSSPMTANDGRYYCLAKVSAGPKTVSLMLVEDAARIKLPLDKEIHLRGSITKSTYKGAASIQISELTMPDGGSLFSDEDVVGFKRVASIKECINMGMRAVKFASGEGESRDAVLAAVFSFAANAHKEGLPQK